MSAPQCRFADDVLLLADGELGFTQRIVVEAHLGVCDSCAALEETVTAIDEVIAAAATTPLGAAGRALARLPRSGPVLRPFVLAAAAAALVFFALLAPHVQRGGDVARSPRVVASAPLAGPEQGSPAMRGARRGREPVPRALPPLPVLPPPLPPVGPTLRRRLADLDLLRPGRDEAARAIAAGVRRRGPRGSRALAAILSPDDVLLRPALDVAVHAESPVVAAALARLVDHPLYGDLAARSLAADGDAAVVPQLAAQLAGRGAAAAREALAEIGGRAAARALVQRFWDAAPEARAALLDAAVRADATVGGAACLEATAAPTTADEPLRLLARGVIAQRAERLLPYLRRTARGRDALRARLAARGLGWARYVHSEALLAALARTPRTAGPATSALLDLGTRGALQAAFDAARLGGVDGPAAQAFAARAETEMHLLGVAQGGDVSARRVALTLLARCGGPPAAEALGAISFPRGLQGDLVATLSAIGGDRAADSLGALADVAGLEPAVIEGLGATRSPAAVPWLVRIAASQPRRRTQVVAALARIAGPESLAALVAMLRDERAGAAALEVVAGLPARHVVPALLEHCGASVPPPVRRALARIAGRDLGSSPAPWREWWAART